MFYAIIDSLHILYITHIISCNHEFSMKPIETQMDMAFDLGNNTEYKTTLLSLFIFLPHSHERSRGKIFTVCDDLTRLQCHELGMKGICILASREVMHMRRSKSRAWIVAMEPFNPLLGRVRIPRERYLR